MRRRELRLRTTAGSIIGVLVSLIAARLLQRATNSLQQRRRIGRKQYEEPAPAVMAVIHFVDSSRRRRKTRFAAFLVQVVTLAAAIATILQVLGVLE